MAELLAEADHLITLRSNQVSAGAAEFLYSAWS